ncbi:MAG: hypothetical protein AB1705_08915 [Verrucomicrobiota bacterium]
MSGSRTGEQPTLFDTPQEPAAEDAALMPAVELDLPKWPFFMADAVLLAATALLVWHTPKPIQPSLLFFCLLAVVAGALVALTPYYLDYRAASRRIEASRLPKWILGEQPDAASPRRYVVHLHWPRFVGELARNGDGDETVRPIWLDNPGAVPELRKAQLLREAVDFVHAERQAA